MTVVAHTFDEEIIDALATAHFPNGIEVRAYRLQDSEHLGRVADILLLIDQKLWDAGAMDACDAARRIARQAFEDIDVLPVASFRLHSEHEAARPRELGVWTLVEPYDAG